jgi:hypothetical protein
MALRIYLSLIRVPLVLPKSPAAAIVPVFGLHALDLGLYLGSSPSPSQVCLNGNLFALAINKPSSRSASRQKYPPFSAIKTTLQGNNVNRPAPDHKLYFTEHVCTTLPKPSATPASSSPTTPKTPQQKF